MIDLHCGAWHHLEPAKHVAVVCQNVVTMATFKQQEAANARRQMFAQDQEVTLVI